MTISLDIPAAGTEALVKGESLWIKARKRFHRHRLALIGLVILCVMVLLAVLAPVVAIYSPVELNLDAMSQPPSTTH